MLTLVLSLVFAQAPSASGDFLVPSAREFIAKVPAGKPVRPEQKPFLINTLRSLIKNPQPDGSAINTAVFKWLAAADDVHAKVCFVFRQKGVTFAYLLGLAEASLLNPRAKPGSNEVQARGVEAALASKGASKETQLKSLTSKSSIKAWVLKNNKCR